MIKKNILFNLNLIINLYINITELEINIFGTRYSFQMQKFIVFFLISNILLLIQISKSLHINFKNEFLVKHEIK